MLYAAAFRVVPDVPPSFFEALAHTLLVRESALCEGKRGVASLLALVGADAAFAQRTFCA